MHDIVDPAGQEDSARLTIQVADETLIFRKVALVDETPTGRQIAKAAGCPANAIVLQFFDDGSLNLVDPDKPIDLRHQTGRFLVTSGDSLYFFTVGDTRYEWPSRLISGAQVRKIANVGADLQISLAQTNVPDRLVCDTDIVNLNKAGIERFETRKPAWKLNVHGVTIVVPTPTIKVRDALSLAGVDSDKPWHIFFLVQGHPKREVSLDDVLDLTTPGIEKIRLTPRDVNNGEVTPPPRRTFLLLGIDTAYLDRLGLRWETVIEADRRWLLIHNYPLSTGYTHPYAQLALEIPPAYPHAAIYGFYAYPPLVLKDGRPIPNTQMRGTIDGLEFHGWSRNRGPLAPWNPNQDSVITHFALVDAALAKELGE